MEKETAASLKMTVMSQTCKSKFLAHVKYAAPDEKESLRLLYFVQLSSGCFDGSAVNVRGVVRQHPGRTSSRRVCDGLASQRGVLVHPGLPAGLEATSHLFQVIALSCESKV